MNRKRTFVMPDSWKIQKYEVVEEDGTVVAEGLTKAQADDVAEKRTAEFGIVFKVRKTRK